VPLDRLSLHQDWHRGVIARQPLCRQNMGLDQGMERGCRALAQAPTWRASVETLRSMPTQT